MKTTIDSSKSIYELVEAYPDIKDIMAELGFKDILKPGMLQSAGRIMTLSKGARMKNIDWQKIVDAFNSKDYELTK